MALGINELEHFFWTWLLSHLAISSYFAQINKSHCPCSQSKWTTFRPDDLTNEFAWPFTQVTWSGSGPFWSGAARTKPCTNSWTIRGKQNIYLISHVMRICRCLLSGEKSHTDSSAFKHVETKPYSIHVISINTRNGRNIIHAWKLFVNKCLR